MVTLTENAAAKMRDLLSQEQEAADGVRLFVARGGCAGMSYGLQFEDAADEADQVFESNGVKVFVDPQSLPLVDGSEVDFVDTIERTGFAVNNPNAASGCGCGNSFQAKEAAAAG